MFASRHPIPPFVAHAGRDRSTSDIRSHASSVALAGAARGWWIEFVSCLVWVLVCSPSWLTAQDWSLVDREVQPKIVKLFGAGGARGLEAYQSGVIIGESGQILTAWSYVLDTDELTVVLDDGRKFTAETLGMDPRLEIAVLKIPAEGLPAFDLNASSSLQIGDRVLAFSNLYGIATGNEPASLLQGFVTSITPVAARRGVQPMAYQGPVYIVDAMTNNAGAAGGALTDLEGRLVGLLGKELRNAQTNVYINYALPVEELRGAVADILAGKIRARQEPSARLPEDPITLSALGLVLVPNVLTKTPPYIERVVPQSPAARGHLQAGDLIVLVGNHSIQSRTDLLQVLRGIDRLDPVDVTVLRDQQLVPVRLTLENTAP